MTSDQKPSEPSEPRVVKASPQKPAGKEKQALGRKDTRNRWKNIRYKGAGGGSS